ncbi:hypothetical protein NPIL_125001 [Nephila pilipes]|uniref:Uncharacterized protein n=1 Tax=Nephila pilipes TaxID=299642 RepID=A0A8X6U1G3_NEPPI|nr:hypothetical protein NPIL_85181 [Nephila pilipes]GFT33067.1 hypothetical protein NPIL_664791 [Nephila pilipes]GFT70210.1 hypothetical protein NPIL_391231 [Nephila pilipes]GFU02195.1 hypothetical protein NPIL_125001 [Nephila pilipes]
MLKLKPKIIVGRDSAPYHSMKKEKILRRGSVYQEWQSEKSTMWNQNMTKIELLQKVGEVKHLYDSYRVEAIEETFGHKD